MTAGKTYIRLSGNDSQNWLLNDQNANGEAGPAWIWPDQNLKEEEKVNQIVDFIHTFNLPSLTGKESIWLSSDTDFSVWLNGVHLGHGQFPNFPGDRTYEELSLQNALKEGSNTLAFTVYHNGRNSSVYLKGAPGLLFTLNETSSPVFSGKDTLWRKNSAYHNGPIHAVSGQLTHTFAYDSRQQDDFFASGYNVDSSWRSIKENECSVPKDRTSLLPRPIKRLKDEGLAEGRHIEEGSFTYGSEEVVSKYEAEPGEQKLDGLHLKDGQVVAPAWLARHAKLFPGSNEGKTGTYFLYDLGQQEVGHLNFKINAPEGALIDIGYGEHLDDKRVRSAIGRRCFGSRYISRGGEQSFFHPFLRWAGRYLQVFIHGGEGHVLSIALARRDFPITSRALPKELSETQKKIVLTGNRTLQLCMHDHYEDTPWREQALYANDARTQALCGYYAFGEFKMPRASFNLLGNGLREDGLLNLTAPAKPPPTIPSFTLVWMLAVRDHLLYSGDTTLAKAFLPQMRDMLGIFIGEMKDGLLPLKNQQGIWHFYDWSAGMSGYEDKDFNNGLVADAPLNCFFILALQATREIISWLNEEGEKELLEIEESVRTRVYDTFYDAELDLVKTHLFNDTPSELTQSLAVLAGIGDRELHQRLLKKVANPKSDLAEAGLSQTLYIFKALLSAGDTFHTPILERIEKTWGAMLDAGASSFWETSKGGSDFGGAGSLCHGWSAVPVYVLYRIFTDQCPQKPGDFIP